MHAFKYLSKGLFLLCSPHADRVPSRVAILDLGRKQRLLLVLALEFNDIRQALPLELVNQFPAVLQQSAPVENLLNSSVCLHFPHFEALVMLRLVELGVTGVEPEVEVAEEKLVDDWDVQLW